MKYDLKYFIHVGRALKPGFEGAVAPTAPSLIYLCVWFQTLNLLSRIYVLFLIVLSGIENESFIGRNKMKATALRQKTEIKLKIIDIIYKSK